MKSYKIIIPVLSSFVLFYILIIPTFASSDLIEGDSPYNFENDKSGEEFELFRPEVKRVPFWGTPSRDYNPMRRPGPIRRRNSKRELPYHPYPRTASLRQRSQMSPDSDDDEELEIGLRDKKQNRAGILLFRNRNSQDNKDQKYVPKSD